jgi:hypothetical protein
MIIYVRIVKSQFYNSIAVSHGGRTVLLTPTALVIIENDKFVAYRIRKRDGIWLEPLKNPSDAPLLFVPEPGTAPNGFTREVKDGKLYAKKDDVVIEVGEVYEI